MTLRVEIISKGKWKRTFLLLREVNTVRKNQVRGNGMRWYDCKVGVFP